MKKYTKKAFTLIELLITITIISLLLTLSYAPYNYYQNKAKLKIATREVSQSMYEARNMAVSGVKDMSTNRSIGLYFTTDSFGSSFITTFSYPYDIKTINIDKVENNNVVVLNKRKLQEGVSIKKIENYGNILFFFEAITGNTSTYSWNGSNKSLILDEEIDILISYKNSDSASMQKVIKYFTETNIVDYK